MSSKFKDMISYIREPKQVARGKEITFEPGDTRALVIAAYQVFGPILLGLLAFFALIIFIIVSIWG